jgi:hypothetical protein
MQKIYSFQEQLIEETESLVAGFFDEVDAELLNFDAIEAICFLIIAGRHVPLNVVSLRNCLSLLGVHPFLLRNAAWFLQKKYNTAPQMDLLSFIRNIRPIILFLRIIRSGQNHNQFKGIK